MTATSTDIVKNAKQLPKRYFGLHFYEGPAEYREGNSTPYRILLNETTLRKMDASFEGRPVYVRHVDEVDLKNIQTEADGWVVRSFWNAADGKHWCEFLAVSDKAHEAIRSGWKLSNAYTPTSFGPGGIWNGIEYQKEVVDGTFEHLALVNDPRYQESIVLSPSQFKEYNENHVLELSRINNSASKPVTETIKSMFKFFKKSEIEKDEISETVVRLKNGKEMTIAQLINAAEEDKAEKGEDKTPPSDKKESPKEEEKQGEKPSEAGEAPQMANMDHRVQVGNDSMPLKDLVAKHMKMSDCMSALSEHHAAMQKNDSEMDGGEKDAAASAESADLTKTNADLDGGEKESESQESIADKTKKNSHFEKVKNAHLTDAHETVVVDLDRLARGKSRYGSGN